MTERPPLALDAMGGDHAPAEVVRGGVEFARATGRPVLLVGQSDLVEAELANLKPDGVPVTVVPAAEVIGFGDKISAIRSKRNSSIHVAARLVREGKACAFVSAGHTGAVMSISKVVFGLLEGVDRPALPATFPRRGPGFTVLLDAGANVDCRPEHFRQFAVMGYYYSKRILDVPRPRVALLSVGEEDTKGNEILREVAAILRETEINFVGNVEGNDLLSDKADVIVCDGFVGNVALKVAEGIAEAIVSMFKETIKSHWLRTLAALPLRPAFRTLMKKVDYAEYGGVPLLGLRQISVVAHGRSDARAIRNALRVADTAAASEIVEKIAAEIAVLHRAEQRLAI